MLWILVFLAVAGWMAWNWQRRRCPRCGSFSTAKFESHWSCDNCNHTW